MNHIPGPWAWFHTDHHTYSKDTPDGRATIEVQADSPATSMSFEQGASIYLAGPDKPDGGPAFVLMTDEPPDEVDAKLIAAAPDLLESLKEIISVFERDHKKPHLYSQYTNAQAAIAKATTVTD